MKKILVGINSQFVHTSLSIRSLQAFLESFQVDMEILEYTINQEIRTIEQDIIEKKPDIIAFSTYIWNQEIVVKLLSVIKKILPKTIIILGGPEASYENDFYMDIGADYLISGEGEQALLDLLAHLETGKPAIEKISRLSYKKAHRLMKNDMGNTIDLDLLPFAYKKADINPHQIYYYQSTRGCPFRCSYCLSSNESYEGRHIRFRSMEKIKNDLMFFINGRVKQVKFIDRTFNGNPAHAEEIWEFLIDTNNGHTNFHFELGADLLTDRSLYILKEAPKGLFQFEVGIQSTDREALEAVGRYTKLDNIFKRVKEILSFQNIHMHVDLIAGLPKEGFTRFQTSFNEVYRLNAHMLQLGFLKLLPGTKLYEERESLGLVARNYPPYEIMKTQEITYDELSILKGVEHMVDIYYNSGQFAKYLEVMVPFFKTPYDFYEALSLFFKKLGADKVKQNRLRRYEILYEFSLEKATDIMEILKDTLAIDLLERENLVLPSWLLRAIDEDEDRAIKKLLGDDRWVAQFLPNLLNRTNPQRSRQTRVIKTAYDIYNGYEKNERFFLFDYTTRDYFSYSNCIDISDTIVNTD